MFNGLISSVTTIPAQEGESSDPIQLPGGDTSLIGGSIGFGYCRLNQRHPLHHVQVVHPGLGDLGCGWSCAALVTNTTFFYTAFLLKDSLILTIIFLKQWKLQSEQVKPGLTNYQPWGLADQICNIKKLRYFVHNLKKLRQSSKKNLKNQIVFKILLKLLKILMIREKVQNKTIIKLQLCNP